jgi:hypothetical protein
MADDDNSELSYSVSSDDESYDAKEEVDRDEVKEVRKLSSKDTNRIRLWRLVVTVVVLLTAVAVTLTTYTLLQQQEEENFVNAVRIVLCPNAIAFMYSTNNRKLVVRPYLILSIQRISSSTAQFEQFSRTVGDNAVNQQKIIREAYVTFCHFFSQSAQEKNATWPFYSLPNFEFHARNIIKIQGTEILTVFQYIKDEDADAALEYVNNHYEDWVMEGHLNRYGNLDRLNPVNYHPYFTVETLEGKVPDTANRTDHYAIWQASPRTYTVIVVTRKYPYLFIL